MDGGAWWAAVHEVAKSRTQLSDFTFTFHFHALEKEMATHSSVLAWRIPGTGEPGGLPSMGWHRVRHDWSDLAAASGVSKKSRTEGYKGACCCYQNVQYVVYQSHLNKVWWRWRETGTLVYQCECEMVQQPWKTTGYHLVRVNVHMCPRAQQLRS